MDNSANLDVPESGNLFSHLSTGTQQSEASTNSLERTRLAHAQSLPLSFEPQQRESFHSRRSFQSQSSSNISSYLTFGSSCQVQGIQGASSSCLKIIQAHQGHISALTVAEASMYMYSAASSSSTIYAWSVSVPEAVEAGKFGKGDGVVKFLLAVGDNRLISAHQDHKIRVWKQLLDAHHPLGPHASSKNRKHTLVATLPTLWNLILTSICCCRKAYVKVRRHKKSLWIQHSDTISALAASADGKLLYSGSWDRTFKVWRLSDYRCLESVEAHADAVNAVAVSSKTGSTYVYTGSADNKIKVWERQVSSSNRKKHSLVATLEGHRSAVTALALSPDDEMLLYSASTDRKILLWEREESANHMGLLGALRGHRQAVLSLAVTRDILCSGSADKTIRVWRRGANNLHSCLALLEGHLGPVKALYVLLAPAAPTSDASEPIADAGNSSSSSYIVYSGSLDSDIRVWLVSPDVKCLKRSLSPREKISTWFDLSMSQSQPPCMRRQSSLAIRCC